MMSVTAILSNNTKLTPRNKAFLKTLTATYMVKKLTAFFTPRLQNSPTLHPIPSHLNPSTP